MSQIKIDFHSLQRQGTSIQEAKASLQRGKQSLINMNRDPYALTQPLRQRVNTILNQSGKVQEHLDKIETYMKESQVLYEGIDQHIARKASVFSIQDSSKNQSTSALFASSAIVKKGNIEKMMVERAAALHTTSSARKGSKWKSYFMKTSESEYNGFDLDRGLFNILKNGASFGGTYSFDMAKATYRDRIGNVNVKGDFGVGNAEVSGKCKMKLFDGKKFDPEVSASVGISASLAHGKIGASYANKVISADVEGKVEVGVAAAKVKAIITPKEVHLEGDVGLALAKASATGSIKIFGVSITATVSGEAGSIGAGGKFSTSSNSFEFGGRLAFLFGGGLNIKVDY